MKQHSSIVISIAKGIAAIVRVLLKTRYKIEIKGYLHLKNSSPKLILPNHTALMDPIIVFARLFRYTTAVPVVTAKFYDIPVIKSLFSLWGAVRVSDLESGSKNVKVLDQITEAVDKGLEMGKNIVLYPSGQLSGQGYEFILGKQSAYQVVNKLPENTKVLVVRTSGLWGSRWSKAWTGKTPGFFTTTIKCLGFVLLNLLFFMPRRKIIIEIEDITEQAKKESQIDRNSFNTYLESVYNKHGEEKVKFIKYLFYGTRLKRKLPDSIAGSEEDAKKTKAPSSVEIPDETFQLVKESIAQIIETDKESINKEHYLQLDLGADSLNIVEIISEVENRFTTFSAPEINDIKTVNDLCLVAMGLFKTDHDLKHSDLDKPLTTIQQLQVSDKQNILQQFVHSFSKNGNDPFCYDSMLGSTNRKTFLLKACVVAEMLKKDIKEQHIGIMLPALQSTTLLIAASYLAGKIPVMLNWTVGKKVLQHCIDITGVKTILSAGAFIDKIEEQLPDDLKDKIVFLEKKVPKLGLATKLKGALKAKMPNLLISTKAPETAVILFTSGSESMPKAVPLTHNNLVSNLSNVFKLIKLDNNFIFLSFLPPFHSFGFTVLNILPLLTAVKVGYTPNPTDGREVLRIMKHIKANILVGTPGFLKLLLSEGSAYEFKSLKYAISGAEAMPVSLKEQFESVTTDGHILEGYGITECSPVLTINPQDKQKLNSVGKFLPGIKGLIMDIDTDKPLGANEAGMIYVSGPNIFNGYLKQPELKPFRTIDGERYYKTGDLGYLDDEGYLFITGRLKRFIKIAGEMISLPFIEKILLEKYGSDEQQVLAVEGSDKITPPTIALFSTVDIDLNEANSYLLKNGVAPIAKLKQVIKVDEIPVLGTGKTDYKVLKAILEE